MADSKTTITIRPPPKDRERHAPIRVLGATEYPVQAWVVQEARNLLMDPEDAVTRVNALRFSTIIPTTRCLPIHPTQESAERRIS